jgi:hypothetical protein
VPEFRAIQLNLSAIERGFRLPLVVQRLWRALPAEHVAAATDMRGAPLFGDQRVSSNQMVGVFGMNRTPARGRHASAAIPVVAASVQRENFKYLK